MRKQNTSVKRTHETASGRQAAGAQSAGTRQPAATSEYSPEVEARRADYEQLVEAFVHMVELETERVWRLDIINDVTEVAHLSRALNDHLEALHHHVDWFDPHTLRKFYVEMRLWGDQREYRGETAERERQAEDERQRMLSLIRSNEEVTTEARRRAAALQRE